MLLDAGSVYSSKSKIGVHEPSGTLRNNTYVPLHQNRCRLTLSQIEASEISQTDTLNKACRGGQHEAWLRDLPRQTGVCDRGATPPEGEFRHEGSERKKRSCGKTTERNAASTGQKKCNYTPSFSVGID